MNTKYHPKHENLDYLRGLILSDGHIRQRDGVRISTANAAFSNHFRDLGYSVTQQINSGYSTKPLYSIRVGNLSFAESLGFTEGTKTLNFKPNENWAIKHPWEFISGMIDGDGTVSRTRAAIELAISCSDILKIMQEVYESVGVHRYGIYKRSEKAYNLYVKNRETELLMLNNMNLRYPSKRLNVLIRSDAK